MRKEQILLKISSGETDRIEFKAINDQLGDSFWETVCAFLNSKGGEIFLGVDNDKNILGINKNSIDKIKSNIITLANNEQKLNPTFGLYPKEIEIEDKLIIQVQVPASSLVHKIKTKNGEFVFIRQHESDTKIIQPEEISKIVNSKKSFYSENEIYTGLTLSDFENDVINSFKDQIRSIDPTNTYLLGDSLSFFKKTKLYKTDFTQIEREEGFTLASVLLFGKDEVIKSILPHYKIDAVVKKKDKESYDDRLLIEDENLNLFSVYKSLMDFIKKHLDDKFYLEEDKRISLRDRIFRELIVNFLIHQDYKDASVSEIVITNDRVNFTNPTNPNPNLYNAFLTNDVNSYPKNPIIQHIFGEIKLFEGRGSGVSKVNKDLPKYIYGAKPIFIEERIFKTIIPLKSEVFSNLINDLNEILPLRVYPELINLIEKLPINMKFNEYEDSKEKIFHLLITWKNQINKYIHGNEEYIGKIKFRESIINNIISNTERVFIEILFNTIKPTLLKTLTEKLGFSHKTNFKKNYLNHLIIKDFINYTIPNKPSSPIQRYVITQSGVQFQGAYLL